MSAKDCGHHDDDRKAFHRRLWAALVSFIILILFLILLIWLILRPTKPHFILQDATVYAFNLTSPATLTTTLQVTLSTRNPNERIGIYYDRVDVYASYHNQQVTLPTLLPATYQGHKEITVWSPFLYGDTVPVAPYLVDSLNQDQFTGTVLINIRVDGRIRWKVGTFISGKYRLNVNCPAYINFGKKNNGISVGSAVRYQLIMDCLVDV
ncbi:NDR1/HIN1-like protein 1 [Primulina eburnea]|uniref:NDR1/HIN1-like protein 1 n=1 Tax=Primulina eburnea TaxID=1245227 RepID=UPI003C6C3411